MSTPKRKVFLIGIGGIGVSALARWYHSRGWDVSGSDSAASVITDTLKKHDVKVFIGSNNSNKIKDDIEVAVYSSAVPDDHPERQRVRKLGIPELSYGEALGAVTKRYKTIAIAGTHGKSTTTAMTALVLKEAGLDPTVIIGTLVPNFGNSNFRKGNSDWLVIEADEYREAFLYHQPQAIIVTNIEPDHLDYYKTYARVKKAFVKFMSRLTVGGLLIQKRHYALNSSRARELKKILKVPGQHNVANALAVDEFAKKFGIKKEIVNRGLKKFNGTWRRFEYKGTFKGAKVYDDYAHHPTEIKATLSAARELYPDARIWCVHQPHHTSRLQSLFRGFTKAFSEADKIIILETYKVRGREQEKNNPKKSAKSLATKIGAVYARNQADVIKILSKEVKSGEVVLITGAGDITDVAKRLVR